MDHLLLQSGVQCLFYLLLSLFLIENATSTALKDSIDVENGVFLYSNFFRFPNHKLNSTPIESIIVDSADDCVEACTELVQCRSLNFGPILKVDNKSICHLLDADKFTSLDLFIESSEFRHYSLTVSQALTSFSAIEVFIPLQNFVGVNFPWHVILKRQISRG